MARPTDAEIRQAASAAKTSYFRDEYSAEAGADYGTYSILEWVLGEEVPYEVDPE